MNQTRSSANGIDSETEITLGVLNAVHENSAVTQRSVAQELGIALGLANAYLKRCVKKGYIKVTQIPANRYAYYLTPTGFAEKSRLTTQYLTMSFDFFRHARTQCGAVFADCETHGWRRVALVGVSDLGEIATLCARDHDVELRGFLDPSHGEAQFAGLPVAALVADLAPVDAWVVTDLARPQETFDAMAAQVRPDCVLAPSLLNISRPGGNGGRP
ncbi:MAG: winged helix-turn-helix transcriptional regulator [Hyphomicrobiales bacterium]|nr:winged helix-turn-helix transcriptional regulator [Hyphomicrobiales bacterium]